FVNETTVVAPGINGKMSEVNAAFGLLQLRYIDAALARRKEIDGLYRNHLVGVLGLNCVEFQGQNFANHAYFPVLIDERFIMSRDGLYEALRAQGIMVRRYFYPLISDFPMYRGLPSASASCLPVAEAISRSVLCLPIYPDLKNDEVETICSFIREVGESRE